MQLLQSRIALLCTLWFVLVCSEHTHKLVSAISSGKISSKLTPTTSCITSADCRVGYMCTDNGNCTCMSEVYHILSCKNQGLAVIGCYCVTYNEPEELMEVGKCLYNCASVHAFDANHVPYISLPSTASELNEFMCESQFNRTGTLCGECAEGLYPLAYSYNLTCVECPDGRANWWKYALAAFLPLTIFYFIVALFNISVSSSNLNAFVYFSQAMTMNGMARVLLLATQDRPISNMTVKVLGSFYGIWNLDFFRFFNMGICLGTDTLQTLTLDLAVGFYPLLLIMVSYALINLYDMNFKMLVILWKPFRFIFGLFKSNWDIRTSLIDAFATFFLLSNVKFLNVTFDLLIPIHLKQVNATGHMGHSWRLFYDASVVYFGRRHLPYAITAIIVLSVFVALPTLLLILYPFRWFHKFLNLFPCRWYVLHTFVDSFQGCYKDGTNRTLDCRWLAATVFASRFTLFIIGAFALSTLYYPVAIAFLIALVIIFINVQPFKPSMSHFTNIHCVLFLLLGLWYTSSLMFAVSVFISPVLTEVSLGISAVVGVFPILYISAVILHWIYSHKTFGMNLLERYLAWKHGYSILE